MSYHLSNWSPRDVYTRELPRFRWFVFLHARGDLTHNVSLGHFQVGSYRYRSLIESLYTL